MGPAFLVTAAFIGPGTVTACAAAGAAFGTALLWVLVVATVSAIVLQEMAARLGAGAGLGLGEALLGAADSKTTRLGASGLLLAALVVGNAAYESGNLAGGALGLDALIGSLTGTEGGGRLSVLLLSGVAAVALAAGRYRALERLLIGLVIGMSVSFLAAAILSRPDLAELAGGLAPTLPGGATLTVLALIGTTIVPYNLFLHAAAAKARFGPGREVAAARRDTVLAVSLGGLVSASILIVAAGSGGGALTGLLDETLGPSGRFLMGLGLAAAGLTSAVTAPMATGFVVSELSGASPARRPLVFKATALGVLAVGTLTALLGLKPVNLILVAQAANGVLLPVVAVFLLVVTNRRALLGSHVNGPVSNLLAGMTVLLAAGLGLRAFLRLAGAPL